MRKQTRDINNLTSVTQLVNGRARIQTQAAWLRSVSETARLVGKPCLSLKEFGDWLQCLWFVGKIPLSRVTTTTCHLCLGLKCVPESFCQLNHLLNVVGAAATEKNPAVKTYVKQRIYFYNFRCGYLKEWNYTTYASVFMQWKQKNKYFP